MVSDQSSEHQPVVSWNKSAYVALQKAYEYIKETSPANAEKVIKILRIRHVKQEPKSY